MKPKLRKTMTALLGLALIASACGADSVESIPAAASSNASVAAVPVELEQFCSASFAGRPSYTDPFRPDGNTAKPLNQSEIDDLRAFVDVIPAEAPNIVRHYFHAWAEVAEAEQQAPGSASFEDMTVVSTINQNDINLYAAKTCPESSLLLTDDDTALDEIIPKHPLISPNDVDFCQAMVTAEQALAAMQRSGDQRMSDELRSAAEEMAAPCSAASSQPRVAL